MCADRLVGRDLELARLHTAFVGTLAGAGSCCVVTGRPGVGKSSLLAAAGASALAAGLTVAAVRAVEIGAQPFASLREALAGARPQPVAVPDLAEHQGDRYWYLDQVGEALAHYSARRPLLIAVDDVQWLDEFSVMGLRVLVPALVASPVCWLLARRPARGGSRAQEAVERLVEDGATQIELRPLDEPAVERLCAEALSARPDATVLSLAARAGGNPLILGLLLQTLRTAQQLVVDDGVATVVGGELPPDLVDALDGMLAGLSPPARRLLQAGAVLNRPFAVQAAARLLEVAAATLTDARDEAVDRAILVSGQARLSFRHDLLRDAVYERIPALMRATLHGRAVAVVRDEGGSATEIREHLVRSRQAGDPQIARILLDAADQAAVAAPETAADLILEALALDSGDNMPARVALVAKVVGLLTSAGRLGEARTLGESVLSAELDPATEATVLLGLAEASKHAGQNQQVTEFANRALSRPGVPEEIQARLYAVLAHARLYLDQTAAADQAGERAYLLGISCKEHEAAVFGNAARSIVARFEGRLTDALAHAQEAVDLADRFAGPARHRHPRIWLGGALVCLDRFAEAQEAYEVDRRDAQQFGTAWSQPLWHYLQASLLLWQGRLDETIAVAEAGTRIAEQLTAQQLSVPLFGLLARVAALRTDATAAHEYQRQMRKLIQAGITAAPEEIDWSTAMVLQSQGRYQPALTALAPILKGLPQRTLLFSNDPGAAAVLVGVLLRVRGRAAAGLRQQGQAVVDAIRGLASRNPGVASLAGAADHAEGLLRADLDALRAAVEHFRGSPRPLARAAAMADTAAAERAAGGRTRALELLREALAEAERCGAALVASTVQKSLAQLDPGHRASQPPEVVAVSPLSSLTRSELPVARLVAAGLTNNEIADKLHISRHTVDSHLRHIFEKVRVNSRVELTRIMVRHDQPGGATQPGGAAG